MSYKVDITSRFKVKAKRLTKKYPSLREELTSLFRSLETNPQQGDTLGHKCYKIRLAIESKGKGKSGGARIITHLHVTETTVYLLTIYDKSEQDNISDNELLMLLKELE